MVDHSRSNAPLYVEVVTCIVLRVLPEKKKNKTLEALILKRSLNEAEGPGLWTIPGGKVEGRDWGKKISTKNIPIFEGVLDRAVTREVLGETGIKINAEDIFTMQKKAVVFVRKNGRPTMVHRFWVFCRDSSTVTLDSEATEYTWVSIDDLSEYNFIGNVGDDIKIAIQECESWLSRDIFRRRLYT